MVRISEEKLDEIKQFAFDQHSNVNQVYDIVI